MNKLLPKARSDEIIEQEAGSELMIYDLRINKAYTLNETSKIIYKACNGIISFDRLKTESNFTADFIHLALTELNNNNLIENYNDDYFSGMTRREVIRRVGLATIIALPVIASITAPPAINAASGCPTPAPVCGTSTAGSCAVCTQTSGSTPETGNVPADSAACRANARTKCSSGNSVDNGPVACSNFFGCICSVICT